MGDEPSREHQPHGDDVSAHVMAEDAGRQDAVDHSAVDIAGGGARHDRRVTFATDPPEVFEYDVAHDGDDDGRGLACMTTIEQVRGLLDGPTRPTVLVAFEFSGALTNQLAANGISVMSCDQRPPQHHHPAYRGDVQDIVALQLWDAIFFVGPNCFQHLRGDHDCLSSKISDGRAFWGAAMVLWCICCTWAIMTLTEQPDTIGHDYFALDELPDVTVIETRTSKYKDSPDKFLRLTIRNMELEPTPFPDAQAVPEVGRTQFKYKDAEERDRERSSWSRFKNLVAIIARAKARRPVPPPRLEYLEQAERFAARWYAAGHPVPHDYYMTISAQTRAQRRARTESTSCREGGATASPSRAWCPSPCSAPTPRER